MQFAVSPKHVAGRLPESKHSENDKSFGGKQEHVPLLKSNVSVASWAASASLVFAAGLQRQRQSNTSPVWMTVMIPV
jgi:hypothetical protein